MAVATEDNASARCSRYSSTPRGKSWGNNDSFQLGTGTTRSSPVQVGTQTDWSSIFCGNTHSVAVKTNGTIWTWGSNTGGQLGNLTTSNNGTPTQLGILTNWSIPSGGAINSYAIKTDGTLWAWGWNSNGVLGIGHSIFTQANVFPSPIVFINSPLQIGAGTPFVGVDTNWSDLSLGADHGMATKTNGTLWGWGVNTAGQIGDGTVTTRSSPTQIGTLTGWSKVSAGASHTMAIYTDGSLWAWGLGTSSQLGDSAITPGKLNNQSWTMVDVSVSNVMAIKSDGTLWGWGRGDSGQLGLNNTTSYSSPVQVGTLTNWSKVSAGINNHVVAVKTDGTLWAWGNNGNFQVGDGTAISRSSPVQKLWTF